MSVIDAIIAKKLCNGGGGGGCAGQFIVNVYNTNAAGTQFAADKTYEEISAAIESGVSVVIHKKRTINAATYKVFHHSGTVNGIYTFCYFTFVEKLGVSKIIIRMVDGKMDISTQTEEIPIVAS